MTRARGEPSVRHPFRLLCLLLAALLAACATRYVDPAAREGRAATLVHPGALDTGVLIDRLDGKPLGVRPVSMFTLAPGEHSLRVRANAAFSRSTPVTCWFDAAPGGRYRVVAAVDRDAAGWGFAIVDEDTGQRVDRPYPTR